MLTATKTSWDFCCRKTSNFYEMFLSNWDVDWLSVFVACVAFVFFVTLFVLRVTDLCPSIWMHCMYIFHQTDYGVQSTSWFRLSKYRGYSLHGQFYCMNINVLCTYNDNLSITVQINSTPILRVIMRMQPTRKHFMLIMFIIQGSRLSENVGTIYVIMF